MKYELKRISVWSAVKIAFILSLILGFFIGILYAMFFAFIAALPMGMMGDEAPVLPAFAGIAAIFIPFFVAFFYAVINTIFTAISTFLFNLISKLTGGLEFELSRVDDVPHVAMATVAPPPPPPPPIEENPTIYP